MYRPRGCGTVHTVSVLATWNLDASHAIVVRRSDSGLELERAGDGVTAAFAAVLASGAPAPHGFGVRTFAPVPACGDGERAITVDQTNESVIVAERLVVKWLPRPPAGPHPGPALIEHLTQVGFTRMPPAYAALWWGDDTLLAQVTGYLPHARDGWDWCVDDLLAEWDDGRRALFPEQLGILAADLHAALATPSELFPGPAVELAGLEELAAWRKQAEATLAAAIERTPGEDGAWLRAHAAVLHADAELPPAGQTPVTRVHGDLHVGQVLRWRGGLAVTDFDGNPAVAGPGAPAQVLTQPAARDVAQLMTSLAHVAAIADKRTRWRRTGAARAFAARAGEEFLAAYRSRLDGHEASELFDERLLRPFAVEQEARELVYAARFLPRWAYAPMSVLRSWYP